MILSLDGNIIVISSSSGGIYPFSISVHFDGTLTKLVLPIISFFLCSIMNFCSLSPPDAGQPEQN